MGNWSERFEYSEISVRRIVPNSGGIYRLIYKKDIDSFIVFYVGQSEDLERRLLEHLDDAEQNPCIKRSLHNYTCYFRFLEVATQYERDRLEEQQITEYKPSCNN